jgi:hypothetical protein
MRLLEPSCSLGPCSAMGPPHPSGTAAAVEGSRRASCRRPTNALVRAGRQCAADGGGVEGRSTGRCAKICGRPRSESAPMGFRAARGGFSEIRVVVPVGGSAECFLILFEWCRVGEKSLLLFGSQIAAGDEVDVAWGSWGNWAAVYRCHASKKVLVSRGYHLT